MIKKKQLALFFLFLLFLYEEETENHERKYFMMKTKEIKCGDIEIDKYIYIHINIIVKNQIYNQKFFFLK